MAEKITEYCGLVIDNFDCDEKMYTACEVTAGNRLFYHVVKTNQFASNIMKEMNRQQLPGEVTFMPLDRLKVSRVSYPVSTDAFPLISRLNYTDMYESIFK